MTTITQSDIGDITGMDDNMSWTFYTQAIRESGDGDGIITTKKVRKYPVAGVLTVELDPGPAVVIAADGKTYPFTVPEDDTTLWPLIQAAVTIPPITTHQQLLDAVDAWLASHTDVWDNIPDKPAFIAAGATAAAARAAIGIDLTDLDEWEWYANLAAFPVTGVTDVVYGARDTEKFYRWSGSAYIQVSGDVAIVTYAGSLDTPRPVAALVIWLDYPSIPTNAQVQDIVGSTADFATLTGAETLPNKTLPAVQLTGAAQVAQSGTLAVNNQADQSTNYERLRLRFNGNVATIGSEAGGTGTLRDLLLAVASTTMQISQGGTTKFGFSSSSGNAAAILAALVVTFTASSGIPTALSITPTINETGTAGYNGLLVNVTETATGSGTKRLATLQVAGSEKFGVDNAGNVSLAGAVNAKGSQLLLQAEADATKQVQFLVQSGQTASTLRTITLPSVDGTLATLAGVEIQTNKTLTAATLGGATVVPTGGTLELHNQADQTTNYERVRFRWNANLATLFSEAAGTGTLRDLAIGTNLTRITLSQGGATKITLDGNSTSNAAAIVVAVTSTFTSSSGTPTALAITPTVNQTSTGGYNALLINVTESATGSGTKRLINAQVAGASKFTVDNTGKMTLSGTAATWSSGAGSPEAVVTAAIGSMYTRTDGGANTTLYVKESGAGNTGWVAK